MITVKRKKKPHELEVLTFNTNSSRTIYIRWNAHALLKMGQQISLKSFRIALSLCGLRLPVRQSLTSANNFPTPRWWRKAHAARCSLPLFLLTQKLANFMLASIEAHIEILTTSIANLPPAWMFRYGQRPIPCRTLSMCVGWWVAAMILG